MGGTVGLEGREGGVADMRHHMPGKASFTFAVEVETQPGDEVRVVGTEPVLGAWNPQFGQVLKTNAHTYPTWSGQVILPASAFEGGEFAEYKFIVVNKDGGVHWEGIPNRRIPGCPIVQRRGRRFGEPDSAQVQQEERQLIENIIAKQSDGDLNSTASTTDVQAHMPAPLGRPASLGSMGEVDLDGMNKVGNLQFWSGAWRAPKPGGRCEDAYVCSNTIVGVADGVSQICEYSEYGINAAAYAQEILRLTCKYWRSGGMSGSYLSKRTIGALRVAEEQAKTYGAATTTLLTVDGSDAFVANLGDSGYILLRQKPWGWDIAESSTEQHHAWNCPYQLTRVPDTLLKNKDVKFDHATDCDKYEIKVQPGDLFLLFTDGLSDNLYWYEVLNVVSEITGKASPLSPEAMVAPQAIAKALVKMAENRSLDPTADTPFARAARRHRQNLPGGKVDDITVAAAWVVSPQAASTIGSGTIEPKMVTLSSLENPSGSERFSA
mmetsp:Transcript_12967/g.29405  ORF Transcript_12967/g.29405 Transcript_12967/m.29405 type:complete len:493 (-) Transcript_12967:43-1521(-)